MGVSEWEVNVGKYGQYTVKSCSQVNDCESKNPANKSRLAGRNVGNMTCTSVHAACQPQLSFLLDLVLL